MMCAFQGLWNHGVCDNMLSDSEALPLSILPTSTQTLIILEIMRQAEEQKSAQRLFVRAAAANDQQAEACLAGKHTYID